MPYAYTFDFYLEICFTYTGVVCTVFGICFYCTVLVGLCSMHNTLVQYTLTFGISEFIFVFCIRVSLLEDFWLSYNHLLCSNNSCDVKVYWMSSWKFCESVVLFWVAGVICIMSLLFSKFLNLRKILLDLTLYFINCSVRALVCYIFWMSTKLKCDAQA